MKKLFIVLAVMALLFLSGCGTGTLSITTEKMGRPYSEQYFVYAKGGELVSEGKTDSAGITDLELKTGKYKVVIPNTVFNNTFSVTIERNQVSEVYENKGLLKIRTSKQDPKDLILYDEQQNSYPLRTEKGGNLDLELPEKAYKMRYDEDVREIEVRHEEPTPVILIWTT